MPERSPDTQPVLTIQDNSGMAVGGREVHFNHSTFNLSPSDTPQAPPKIRQEWRISPPTEHFMFRKDAVEQLLATLDPSASQGVRSLVVGMGGVGKTELVKKVAQQLKARFPQGGHLIDLKGVDPTPKNPREVRLELLHVLGITMQNPDAEEAGWYEHVVREHKLLVVLDNVESETQVGELLLDDCQSGFILTARRTLPDLERTQTIDLLPFKPSESLALLRTLAKRGKRADGPESQWQKLITLCDNLPLVITQLGRYWRRYPNLSIQDLLDEVEELRDAVEWLEESDAVLALSAHQLAREDAKLYGQWQLLTLLRRPFDHTLAMPLWNAKPYAAKKGLDALHGRSLLLKDQTTGLFSFHDRMRAVAQRLETPSMEPDRLAAHQRLADHFAALASRRNQGGDSPQEQTDDPYAFEWVEAAYHLFQAKEKGFTERFGELVSADAFWSLLEASIAFLPADKHAFVRHLDSWTKTSCKHLQQELEEEKRQLRGIHPRYAHLVSKFFFQPETRAAIPLDVLQEVIDAHWEHNPLILHDFALLAKHIAPNHREQWFRQALELDPNNALHLGNFANFMTDVRKDHNKAEKLYRRAIEANLNQAGHLVNFAVFLTD
ncbi:MAG: hypothetical protein HQM01_13765, partial [Magnetococcales bacterium]|nr:hypothetical protein [Magnetococcales bacterium]